MIITIELAMLALYVDLAEDLAELEDVRQQIDHWYAKQNISEMILPHRAARMTELSKLYFDRKTQLENFPAHTFG